MVAARKAAEWWQRRKALQAFAPARGWQWRGTLDSGAHYPYMAIPRLRRSAALLQNVVQGVQGGYDLYLFDISARRIPFHTGVIVQLPEEPAPFRAWAEGGVVKPLDFASSVALGPRFSAALIRHSRLAVQAEASLLLVEAPTCVRVEEVPAFLDGAVSLANALLDDMRAARVA